MDFESTIIKDVILIKPKVIKDSRGFFIESYKKSEFVLNNIPTIFNQENISVSTYGVIRGLHFQLNPLAQAKLVRCVQGTIFDVAVDIRKNSPTYLKSVTCILSEQNQYMLYIPQGFAHGFLALSTINQIMYKCSSEYDSSLDRGIIYNDPTINIAWPKINGNYIISNKDLDLPQFSYTENNF